MKKEYVNPELQVIKFAAPVVLQNASPTGVETGGSTNNGYSSSDVSFSSEFFGDGDSEGW